MSEKERYFIDSDNSAHKYLVPVSIEAVWEEWVNLPEDDERGWEPPEGAERIDVGRLTFTDPKIG